MPTRVVDVVVVHLIRDAPCLHHGCGVGMSACGPYSSVLAVEAGLQTLEGTETGTVEAQVSELSGRVGIAEDGRRDG